MRKAREDPKQFRKISNNIKETLKRTYCPRNIVPYYLKRGLIAFERDHGQGKTDITFFGLLKELYIGFRADIDGIIHDFMSPGGFRYADLHREAYHPEYHDNTVRY